MIDTKDKILDAAEGLFADQGFGSTSLRDITAEAGVNLASVNYHFGSKLALLTAVFARRFGPVNAERLARLDELEKRGTDEPAPVQEVLRAFLAPIFDRLQRRESGWAKFMQLVGRMHSERNEEIRGCFTGQFDDVGNRFIGALARALPDLPREVLGYRAHFVVGAMAHTFTFCQGGGMPLVEKSPSPDAILDNLVDFAAAGLRAPLRSVMTEVDAS